MTDDRGNYGLTDKINLNQDSEVREWCDSLECSEQQLRSAIGVVGSSAKAVRTHLGRDPR